MLLLIFGEFGYGNWWFHYTTVDPKTLFKDFISREEIDSTWKGGQYLKPRIKLMPKRPDFVGV